MKDEFYRAMGWDVKTGLPEVERLRGLGLQDIAEELQKLGIL
jgi:aldehyde:ferredoxin oxidoreductase